MVNVEAGPTRGSTDLVTPVKVAKVRHLPNEIVRAIDSVFSIPRFKESQWRDSANREWHITKTMVTGIETSKIGIMKLKSRSTIFSILVS